MFGCLARAAGERSAGGAVRDWLLSLLFGLSIAIIPFGLFVLIAMLVIRLLGIFLP